MKYIIVILSAICVISCTSKKNNPSPAATVPEIDGVQLTDFNANPMGIDGTPNIKMTDSLYLLMAYPNPCYTETFYVISNHGGTGILQATLVAGKYAGTLPTGAVVANQSLFGQLTPVRSVTDTLVHGNNSFNMSTDSLPTGFYRMNIYISGANGNDTFWNNILVQH